ncbi:substrate-binding domain-containing protein [Acinetobacter baumannii]
MCLLLPSVPEDVVAYPLLTIDMASVVAPNHPLATLEGPVTQNDLESYIQLILSDNVDPNGPSYGITSAKLWRFVDIGRRLDFLLAGFGWCRMPNHLVTDAIKSGQLIRIDIENDPTPKEGLTIYAAHLRDRPLGIASRWLLDELKQRLC